jgi:hypothetical protein
VGHQASGNWIAGNCAELTNYQYFAKLTNAPENTFLGNSLWDIAGNTASFFFLDSASGAASVPGLIQQAHYDYITPLTSGPGAGGAGYHIVSRETYWGGTSHTFLSPVTFNSTATFNTDMTLAGVTKITNASGLYIQTSGMANVNISAGNGAAQGLVQLDSVGNFFFRNSQQSSGGLYFDFPSSGAVSFRSGGSSTVAQISSTGADFSGLRIQYLASVAAGPTFAFSANSCAASVQAGGATAGRYQSGTTGTCSIALLLPNAPHEWFCTATNITNPANTIRQTTISGSGPVLSGTTAAGDQIQFACTSY